MHPGPRTGADVGEQAARGEHVALAARQRQLQHDVAGAVDPGGDGGRARAHGLAQPGELPTLADLGAARSSSAITSGTMPTATRLRRWIRA